MKLAVFQMSATADPDTNPDRIEDAMRRARAAGADVVVVPELALSGYGRGDALRNLAQPSDGAWVQRMKQAAIRIGIDLVAGFPERNGEEVFISAMAVKANPVASVHIYRKTFLYGDYEKEIFQPHTPSVATIEMRGVSTGFLICYDVEFPENTRRLAQAGADLVIVPTALPTGTDGRHIASRVIPVRAFENQIFLAYANHAGSDGRFHYQGLSSIAAPDGSVLVKAGEDEEALIFAEIDVSQFEESRHANPYLADLNKRGIKAS
ncbi:carbon-nitrogen hydrolase family protein [Roseovarius aestuarii]|uniref:(R)-stereoselective amidase n=1 Tax=Roseovarius aestuarii TaxID=475083 RepID=A0A1X7BYH6_9RHOB|nr:carbon-nitrogen hydrolase family protein [Roseovarius aestuarii]SMC14658.1 (R)-stereoselective amidase [Roseovarius aestuarii]